MAHELEMVNGQIELALAGNKPAWHGLGTVLPNVPDSAEMIRAAHLDWQVNLEEIALLNKPGIAIPGKRATVRADTGKTLGIVSDSYEVVQNQDAFLWLDSLLMDGVLKYESAGALRGGERVFALARMPGYDEIAEGDKLMRYVLFSTSHCGDGGLFACPTSVRIVCANTHAQATNDLKGIRHIGDMTAKMEQAKRYISQFDKAFTMFRDKARFLATRQVRGTKEVNDYIDTLFPPVNSDNPNSNSATIRKNKVATLKQLWANRRNEIPAIKSTWWAAYNGVSEMVDHHSTHRAVGINPNDEAAVGVARRENRMLSVTSGPGQTFKDKAFKLACKMAGI